MIMATLFEPQGVAKYSRLEEKSTKNRILASASKTVSHQYNVISGRYALYICY